jgi:2-polyprenyl-3-methyl-5-hydroxy-6-metoxy-1,4-benzoquinol methylase
MNLSKRFWKYNLRSPKIKKYYSDRYKFIKWVDGHHLYGKAKKLLDVGCGEGNLDVLLSKKYELTGIDISRKALSMAKTKVPKALFALKDIRTFRTDKKYDIIVSACAIDHGHNLRSGFERIIKNLSTCLNDNGALIFDLHFLKELWIKNGTVTTSITNSKESYIRVFHREVENTGTQGVSYQVTTMIKGNSIISEASPTHKTANLLELKKIKRLARKLGFKFFLYDGWKNKPTKAIGNEAPVCVLIKLSG